MSPRPSRSNVRRWRNRRNRRLRKGVTQTTSKLDNLTSSIINKATHTHTHAFTEPASNPFPTFSPISSPGSPDTPVLPSTSFLTSSPRSPTPNLSEPSPSSPPPSILSLESSPSPSPVPLLAPPSPPQIPVITLDSDPPSPSISSESSEFLEDPEDFARDLSDVEENSHDSDSGSELLNYFISQFPLLESPIPEGSFCVGPGPVNHEDFRHYLSTASPDAIIPWFLPGSHLPLAVPIQALLKKFPPSTIQFDDL